MVHVAVLLSDDFPSRTSRQKECSPRFTEHCYLLHGPCARSTDQDCRAETVLQRCGREMDNPKTKMGHHGLYLVYLLALRQHSGTFMQCKFFYKYFSKLLRLFSKGDPAMTPDKSFLLCQ